MEILKALFMPLIPLYIFTTILVIVVSLGIYLDSRKERKEDEEDHRNISSSNDEQR